MTGTIPTSLHASEATQIKILVSVSFLRSLIRRKARTNQIGGISVRPVATILGGRPCWRSLVVKAQTSLSKPPRDQLAISCLKKMPHIVSLEFARAASRAL